MIKFITRYRDLLLLGLLIFMIHIAMKEYPGTSLHYSFKTESTLHPSSLAEDINKLIDQIEYTLARISENAHLDQLEKIKHKLINLAHESTLPHPAYILLGPIASTGIALKEQKIERKVIPLAKKVGQFFALIFNKKYEDIERSLPKHIEYNALIINTK